MIRPVASRGLLLAALLFLITPNCAHAQNLLTNGGFELGTFVNTGGGYQRIERDATTLTGWTVISNELVRGSRVNDDMVSPPEGDYFLDLTSYGAVDPRSGVAQTFATVPGNQYEFSLMIFNPVDGGLNSVDVSTGGAPVRLTNYTGSPVRLGFSFTADSSSTNLSIQGVDSYMFLGIDDVRVQESVPAVPEPSGGLLLGAGLSAVMLVRRRRRHPDRTNGVSSR